MRESARREVDDAMSDSTQLLLVELREAYIVHL